MQETERAAQKLFWQKENSWQMVAADLTLTIAIVITSFIITITMIIITIATAQSAAAAPTPSHRPQQRPFIASPAAIAIFTISTTAIITGLLLYYVYLLS